MVFGNPYILYCLWLLPALGWLLVWAHRKRRDAAQRFADPAMVARLMPAFDGPRPWIKGTLILLAVACFIFAAARPKWGVYFEKVTQRGVDLFVLLDVSRSMTAEDVTPNRLEHAKLDIKDLLEKLPGDRVGLIAFAGKPSVKAPLTTDQGFFLTMLDEIDTNSAPRGGTAIGDAIRKGIEAMPERADRDQVMLLITDGEDQESFPEEAARQAAERGIKIFTVGMGDAREGARIPLDSEAGKQRYLKYKDAVHWSKMNEGLLQTIAADTGGAYVGVGTQAYDLGEVYENHLAELARGEQLSEQRKRFRERFQWAIVFGVVLMMANMMIPEYSRKNNSQEVDK